MSLTRRTGGRGGRRTLHNTPADAAPPAWAPSDSALVKRWWRADLGRTMVSTKVSAWEDQVEGVSVTQGTDAKRPTVATHAGQDALVYSGGQCLRGSGFVSLSNPSWSAVVVGECDSASGNSEVFVDDGDSNTNNWLIWYANGAGWRGNAGTNLTTGAVAQTGIHAHWLKANSSSSDYYIDDFGTARVSGNAGTSANESMTVGATHNDLLYLTGKVSEIIIIDGTVLPSELAGYLTDRYTGLTVTT